MYMFSVCLYVCYVRDTSVVAGSCLNVDTPDKRGSSPISLDSSSDG